MFYEPHVFVCQNQRPADHPRGCCRDKGSQEMHHYMKSRSKELGIKNTRINQSGCMERCEMGPTMVIYPEGVWYTCPTKADIDEILETHLVKGGRVERLLLRTADKLPADRAKG
jgi:(2Fe-2S) ferredoxin